MLIIVTEKRALTFRIFLISLFFSFLASILTFHLEMSFFYVSRIENNDGTYFLIDRRLVRNFRATKYLRVPLEMRRSSKTGSGCLVTPLLKVSMVVYDRSSYFSFNRGGGESSHALRSKITRAICCSHVKQRVNSLFIAI